MLQCCRFLGQSYFYLYLSYKSTCREIMPPAGTVGHCMAIPLISNAEDKINVGVESTRFRGDESLSTKPLRCFSGSYQSVWKGLRWFKWKRKMNHFPLPYPPHSSQWFAPPTEIPMETTLHAEHYSASTDIHTLNIVQLPQTHITHHAQIMTYMAKKQWFHTLQKK